MRGIINEVNTPEKAVAITFDDGPNPIYTPQVLEIFAEADGKATYFMIGEQMLNNPDIVRRAVEHGHEIGNHTYTHAKLSGLGHTECLDEVERNEKLIEELTGKKPAVFRFPYLDFNEETVSLVGEKGYSMIGALNLEARDWEQPGADHILSLSRDSVKNGSILLFHDGYGDRSQTIDAVRTIVSELKAQGFRLVTVSELLRSED